MNQATPSSSGHVPESEAPREGQQEDRELTEYRQPRAEREQPGGRETERRQEAGPGH
jgi:hypothetical protein